jgi:hypothetical protein
MGLLGKIFGKVISGKDEKTGDSVGIMSLIKEKTGKISFKRSASIVAITWAMKNSAELGEITWQHAVIICVALLAPAIGGLFDKLKSRT